MWNTARSNQNEKRKRRVAELNLTTAPMGQSSVQNANHPPHFSVFLSASALHAAGAKARQNGINFFPFHMPPQRRPSTFLSLFGIRAKTHGLAARVPQFFFIAKKKAVRDNRMPLPLRPPKP